MSGNARIVIIVVLALAIAAILVMKKGRNAEAPAPSPASSPAASPQRKLPALYEFGAGKCVQCKNMAPIIEALAAEYVGVLDVRKIDVNKDQEITEKHRIVTIPCQVFLDSEGRELFRHEGFFEKAAIVKKLDELGVKPGGH